MDEWEYQQQPTLWKKEWEYFASEDAKAIANIEAKEQMDKEAEEKIIKLALQNIRIVGFSVTGCSECPFSMKHSEINYADPDEGYYTCNLLERQKVWGENPECTDKDWIKYVEVWIKLFQKERR